MSQRGVSNPFEGLETDRLTFGHLKVILMSGMGFFTDAYDLFNIGVILIILGSLWKLTEVQESLLASASLWATIAGQLVFGRLLDLLGRKRIYGIEAAILSAGALASAFSTNFAMLLATRVVMGLGIGGDYPASSTIASEYAPTKSRGRMVALVFSMQGLGIATAVLVGLISAAYLPPDLAWRVIAAVGAVPPLIVIYWRRHIPETPRYALLVKGDVREAELGVRLVSYRGNGGISAAVAAADWKVKEFLSEFWVTLIGTAVPWLLMDVALYGTGVFSSAITSTMLPGKTLFASILRAGVPLLIGIPGYFMAAWLIDRAGRKPLQIVGFAAMSAIYAVLALAYAGSVGLNDLTKYVLFGLTFTFINLGPNTTTFVIPAEVYPVKYRSTGHGLSAAAGKLGAALSTSVLPLIKVRFGLFPLFLALSLISAVGLGVTAAFTPEAKGLSLEEASREVIVARSPQPVRTPLS
ncbi:MAG: MFS transporter [Acidilobus sp.]